MASYIKIDCTIKDTDGNTLGSGITPQFWQADSASSITVWNPVVYPQSYYYNVKQYWKVGGESIAEGYEFDRVEIGASSGEISVTSSTIPYAGVDVSSIIGTSSLNCGTLYVTYFLSPTDDESDGDESGGDDYGGVEDALLYGHGGRLLCSRSSGSMLCGRHLEQST